MPTINRDLNFRVTVRDNRLGGGGVNYDEMKITVVNTGSPFRVTNTSVTWTGGTTQTITWDVAGTAAMASYVNIRLSLDSGNTFPIVIDGSTPNDGSHTFTVPNVDTTDARIKIRGFGNVFFDVSDADFSIERSPVDFDLLGISRDGGLYDVDQLTGVATGLLPIYIDSTVGIATSPVDGFLYTVADYTAFFPNTLLRIDLARETTRVVGATGLPNGITEGDLDFDPTTGVLYGLSTRVPGSNTRQLFTLDTDTGAATVVATIPSFGDLSAMAFNADGDLYVLDTMMGFENLMMVDKATGAILSQVTAGEVGENAGMDFHPETGELFVVGGGFPGIGRLYNLDTDTGSLTMIGSTGLADGLAGLEFNGPGEIRGTKWHDVDGDGVRDAGEPGLPGWTVYLDENNNGRLDDDDVEPDDYADGTELNRIIPEATLTAIGSAVATDQVTATTDSFASTGDKVFVNDGGNYWTPSSRRLSIDFSTPVSTVSIDFISDDSSDMGRLEVYDAGDNLLKTYITADLGEGAVETMTLSRLTADIAYAIAGGHSGQSGRLDNLVFGEASTLTDSNGRYRFVDLSPGVYTVAEVRQSD